MAFRPQRDAGAEAGNRDVQHISGERIRVLVRAQTLRQPKRRNADESRRQDAEGDRRQDVGAGATE